MNIFRCYSVTTEKTEDYGWNALGAITGTVGNPATNKVGLKNPFLNSLSSGFTSEVLSDSDLLKKQFNNIYKVEYEKK